MYFGTKFIQKIINITIRNIIREWCVLIENGVGRGITCFDFVEFSLGID